MDFKSLLKEYHLQHYCNIYSLPDYKRFILLVESDDLGLNLKVSDGIKVFVKKLGSTNEVVEMQKKSKMPTLSATLHWLKQKLDGADISFVLSDTPILYIGENKVFQVELELSDQASIMLFPLATLAHQLQKENQSLRIKNEKLESENASKEIQNHSPSPNKKSLITGNKVSKKGMSIVNPTNRKRKVAKGLKFSEDTPDDADN